MHRQTERRAARAAAKAAACESLERECQPLHASESKPLLPSGFRLRSPGRWRNHNFIFAKAVPSAKHDAHPIARVQLLDFILTPGNTHDLKPVLRLVKRLFGKLFGDKAYLSQPVFKELLEAYGIQLITKLTKNIKNRLIPLTDKFMLRKRAIVETIVDQLKNFSQIEHSRHRSLINFLVNVLCGLIAYCHPPKKPSIHPTELPALLPA